MIIVPHREQVIQNIKKAANARHFTAKTELNDPQLALGARLTLVHQFWRQKQTIQGKWNNRVGHVLIHWFTATLSRQTQIEGIKNLATLPAGGAIVTCNHFNHLDALAIEKLAFKTHHQLAIVIEDTNLKLPGFLGYLMTNLDAIPLVTSSHYLGHELPQHLHEALAQGKWVLIFPEQEMWWNYRKPRKPQRGAYYFAVQQNQPLIPCFVEICDQAKLERQDAHFYQTRYIDHVLAPIYPDPKLTIDQNATRMMQIDYAQKRLAYEKYYHKPLTYDFEASDIAGWRQNHTK